MRIDRGERIREAWCRVMANEAIHDDEERGKVPSTAEKVAGGIEMAAGVAIAAAGVPMMVLPGPGAALASKGQRRYSGREATAVEEKLDQASAKAAEMAKREGAKAAKAVARNAPKVAAATAKAAVRDGAVVAKAAAKGGAAAAKAGGRLAGKGLDAAAVAYLRHREQKRGDAL